MTDGEIEDLLPLPFKIEISVDQDSFQNQVGHSIRDARLSFNKRHKVDIEVITVIFHDELFLGIDGDDDEMEPNRYKIFIGKNCVMEGEINPEELTSLVPMVQSVLQNFKDEILQQQEENKYICDNLDAEGRYGILFNYYKNIGDNKNGFHYLKKAAATDDRYKRGLYRAYNGTGAVVHKDSEMARKINMKYKKAF